jgi:HEPN domain-containing protein
MGKYDDADILEQRAAEDLRAAETLLEKDDGLLEHIGFHLQQFVEKKMKAELSRRRVNYPWTHDLGAILKLFPHGNITEDEKILLYILSRFAQESRYIDYFAPPPDVRQMLDRANKFAEIIGTLWES